MKFNQTGMIRADLDLVRFMRDKLSEGCDIEEYNAARAEACDKFGIAAAARWDMSGAIKTLKVDNTYGRYNHLIQTRKKRNHAKRKNHA